MAVPIGKVKLEIDGEEIRKDQTPEDLDLDDGDLIDGTHPT